MGGWMMIFVYMKIQLNWLSFQKQMQKQLPESWRIVWESCDTSFTVPWPSILRCQQYEWLLKGFTARIEKDVPAVLYLHCFTYCRNFCLQSVGRKCVVVRDALDLVMEISQLIRFSPKRCTLFLNACAKRTWGFLQSLCPAWRTVWTAAISAILSNYFTLLAALEQINAETHDEYGQKAGGYLAQMEKFSTFFGLKLAHLIFAGTEQITK